MFINPERTTDYEMHKEGKFHLYGPISSDSGQKRPERFDHAIWTFPRCPVSTVVEDVEVTIGDALGRSLAPPDRKHVVVAAVQQQRGN